MSRDLVLGAVLAIALLGYFLGALIRPNRF